MSSNTGITVLTNCVSNDKLSLHERYVYIYNCEEQQKVWPLSIKWFDLLYNVSDTEMRTCLTVLFTPNLFNGTGMLIGPISNFLKSEKNHKKTSIMTPGDLFRISPYWRRRRRGKRRNKLNGREKRMWRNVIR